MVETWWAIGTSPGDTDLQPFVNIGTQSSVSNTSLEGLLLDNHTYYVTLKCINGAGLMTVNSSQGEVNHYSSLPSNGGKIRYGNVSFHCEKVLMLLALDFGQRYGNIQNVNWPF